MNAFTLPFVQARQPHPRTGESIISRIEQVRIERNLAGAATELIASLSLGKRLAIVYDNNTFAALGQQLNRALESSYQLVPIQLGEQPQPNDRLVEWISSESKSCDALIAVGSGTISDLCKYSSFLAGKPYAVFATAPSMNGYGSANASISVNGYKKTLPAHLPKGLFFDLDVMAKAPKRLIHSGLADSLCRSTAQTDWLMSHLLFDTPYDASPFDLLKPYEGHLLENSKALVQGDEEALRTLIITLVLSGMGMVIAGGSYPASQGEHLIAHTMEMVHGDKMPHTYHGEQIGVTTLMMARLQQALIQKLPHMALQYRPLDEDGIVRYFGMKTGADVIKEFRKKMLSPLALEALAHKISVEWEAIAEKLEACQVPFDTLRMALARAGAPTTIEQLGWNAADYTQAVHHAHFIRNRYTFLDLAYYGR